MKVCNLSDYPASKKNVQGEKGSHDGERDEFIFNMDLISGVPEPKPERLRAGSLCPICKKYRLDYDGQINLACPKCGVISGGCFT